MLRRRLGWIWPVGRSGFGEMMQYFFVSLPVTYFFICLTEDEEGLSRVAGSSIFTFQKNKRAHSMAQTGEILARSLPHQLSHIVQHQLFYQMIIMLFF